MHGEEVGNRVLTIQPTLLQQYQPGETKFEKLKQPLPAYRTPPPGQDNNSAAL